MSDWEEIRRLAADFQRAQLAGSAQKLSERNCIEIVTKLIGKDRVDRVPGFLFSRPKLGPPASAAGDCHTRLREREWADPIRTKEQTLWYSRYWYSI